MHVMLMLAVMATLAIAVSWQPYEHFMDAPGEDAVCAKVRGGEYPQIPMDDVVPREVCRDIVREADAHAAANGGWETKRHASYPTTDLEWAKIDALKIPIENIVYRHVVPRMCDAFGLNPLKLGISEVFIAKYAAEKGKQRSLAMHTDGSDFSFVIALNDGYEGGGTHFEKSDKTFKPSVGSGVAFCGQSRHRGLKVTSNVRYIMAGFLTYGTPDGCRKND